MNAFWRTWMGSVFLAAGLLTSCQTTAPHAGRPELPLEWVFLEERSSGDFLPYVEVYLEETSGTRHEVLNRIGPSFRELSRSDYDLWGLPGATQMAAVGMMADAGDLLYVTHDWGKVTVFHRKIDQRDGWTPVDRRVGSFQL